MQPKIILFTSLLFFTIILFGLEKLFHSPFTILITTVISYFISIRLIAISHLNFYFFRTNKYLLWLLREVFLSAWNVAQLAWQPMLNIKPSIKWIEVKQQSDIGIVVYANSITLTPGTITIETNNNNLLIHALDTALIEDLKSGMMENKILKIIK
jgi:multicomponent Na+:H+ antiporter subunit E